MPEKKIRRLALYLRKACDEGDATYDTETLGQEFCDACAREFGSSVKVIIYHDTASSGMHTERPALQRLLQDAQNRRIDVVAYPDLFHLSRNSSDEAILTRHFATYGIPVIDGTSFMRKA